MGGGEVEVEAEEVEGVEKEEVDNKIMTRGSQVINMKIKPINKIPLALTQVQTMDVLTKLTATRASCITTPISKNKI